MRKELAEWKLNVDKDKGKGGKKGKGKVIGDRHIICFCRRFGHGYLELFFLAFFLPRRKRAARAARRRKRRKI